MALLLGLGFIALLSTGFGILMALASGLPELEEPASRNSKIVDRNGRDLGILTDQNRILLSADQISPLMKHAIIAIEDERFYTHEGVDLRAIGRALWQDVVHQSAVQGGSTIAQQFVKNALAAQNKRTVLTKMREAALAYHLTRRWSRDRILRNYLNTIYFGNGAYGIESAARIYFRSQHPGCEKQKTRPCAAQLEPHEAALLAGIVASPTGFDPIAHPEAARRRRNMVLQNMVDQGYLSPAQFAQARMEGVPVQSDLQPPNEHSKFPYFTSWIRQQVVDQLGGGQQGARQAYEGGLTVRTSLDARLQVEAEKAVAQWLPNQMGPRASLVAIDNASGEVLAMVSGDDYNSRPFNLATQGQRQPGSAFKPFVLAEALRQGISPSSRWVSKQMTFNIPGSSEKFSVNNYEDSYSGVNTLAGATTVSDNAIYAQVGIKVGPAKIARLAQRMGIRTPVSKNYAMSLGGLHKGVSALDMAHAYQTFASGGKLVYGTLSPGANNKGRAPGPVGIREILRPDGRKKQTIVRNKVKRKRVLSARVASTVSEILGSVVRVGTGKNAQLSTGEFVAGKTGTTENYGDAWFAGWTKRMTVVVWAGYPDKLRPMETEFSGKPVAGGTFPALIWQTFMEGAIKVAAQKKDSEATEADESKRELPQAAPSSEEKAQDSDEANKPKSEKKKPAPADPQRAPDGAIPEQNDRPTPAEPPRSDPERVPQQTPPQGAPPGPTGGASATVE